MLRLAPCALAMLILSTPATSTAAVDSPTGAGRVLVLDGSAVHDLADVQLNVTNFGLIGSRWGSGAPFSQAPSLLYPAQGGVNHLWAAGLWVGGLLDDGVARVSTGQYSSEFVADPEDPVETIYRSGVDDRGRPHGRRYPAPNADDDHDGLVDEDPLDGRDNDQDGLVDEDFARIGDQYFRAVMHDDLPFVEEILPDHSPLGIEVVQRSFQFSDERYADCVGFRYEVTNRGTQVIRQPRLGLFADFDIGDGVGSASNDLAAVFRGTTPASDGTPVDLTLAYMHSSDPTDGAWAGVILLDANQQTGGVRFYSGNQPFGQGGDPTNDAERYLVLSSGGFDAASARPNDYRIVVSSALLADLDPGASTAVDIAFVLGESLEELLVHAADVARLAQGEDFDLDRDPTTGVDGKEVHVPWFLAKGRGRARGHGPSDGLRLSVGPRPANPAVVVEYALENGARARLDVYDLRGRHVIRLLDEERPAGEGSLVWNGRDAGHRPVASGTYLLRLTAGGLSTTARAVIVR